MELHPIVIQTCVAIPVIVGLVFYTLFRWDRTPVHLLLAATLMSLWPWLGALAVKQVAEDPGIRSVALDVELIVASVMPPLFVVTMGHFARIPAFERGKAISLAFSAVSLLFTIAYLTDAHHQLIIFDRAAAVAGAHPRAWGGAGFWAFQICAALSDGVGIAFCLRMFGKGRTRHERRRGLMILGAILCPLLAHFLFVLDLQPVDYTLVPAALGATAILFTHGIHNYGLLDSQPIVRTDLIEHLQDALVLADADGIVLDANAAAESVLRTDRSRLRGLDLRQVLALLEPADEASELLERIAALPLDGGHTGGMLPAGGSRVFEVTAGAVAARGYQPAGRFLSLRDRSEQIRSERRLREQQKLESVGILAAGVAHEVNNPLSYVRSNLAHLQTLARSLEKGVDGEHDLADLLEIPEVLAESLEGLDRISGIVDSMLRFSRVPAEGTVRVDVNQVVRSALKLAELHKNRSVRVGIDLDPDLPEVVGSSERLVQVLLNLLLNGKQALEGLPDARIVAETKAEGASAVVRVRDNGPGIPEEHHERIFDPFFTTRAPDEGTGLGLAICFDIVREHGGTLELESQRGEGTCFTIRLPAAKDETVSSTA